MARVTDVLIRDVPPEDLEQIRAAAAARGTSVQAYLLETVHAQAAHERRRAALAAAADRLHGRAPVTDAERQAVLDAVDAAHTERDDQLTRRPAR
jgi:hypothetical protein